MIYTIPSIYQSFHLRIFLSICKSISLCICICIYLFVCHSIPVCSRIILSVRISIYGMYLFIYQAVHLRTLERPNYVLSSPPPFLPPPSSLPCLCVSLHCPLRPLPLLVFLVVVVVMVSMCDECRVEMA